MCKGPGAEEEMVHSNGQSESSAVGEDRIKRLIRSNNVRLLISGQTFKKLTQQETNTTL